MSSVTVDERHGQTPQDALAEATGARPLWLKFHRYYQEGRRTPTPLVAGLNVAVTGLGN